MKLRAEQRERERDRRRGGREGGEIEGTRGEDLDRK